MLSAVGASRAGRKQLTSCSLLWRACWFRSSSASSMLCASRCRIATSVSSLLRASMACAGRSHYGQPSVDRSRKCACRQKRKDMSSGVGTLERWNVGTYRHAIGTLVGSHERFPRTVTVLLYKRWFISKCSIPRNSRNLLIRELHP